MITSHQRPKNKKARSRATLIEIATQLFEKDGIQNTSLTKIATAANMTKGAIYSSFKSKEKLVLAVMLEQDLMLKPQITPDMNLRDILREIGISVSKLSRSADNKARLIAEYQHYAMNSGELRLLISNIFKDRIQLITLHLSDFTKEMNPQPNAKQLAITIEALASGFVIQRLMMPEQISDNDIIAAFESLV